MNALYDKGREGYLNGTLNWLADDVRAILVDTALYTVNLVTDQFLTAIPVGARISTSGSLTTKTATNGVADADDVSFVAVVGATVEAIVLYKHTGVDATARLIAYIDSAAGLPFLPSGGNVAIQWDNGAFRIFKLLRRNTACLRHHISYIWLMPICLQCQQPFEQFQKHNTTGKFCSRKCWYDWPGRVQDRECPVCLKPFRPNHSQQKTCGRKCGDQSRRTAKRETHCAFCQTPLSPTCHPRVRFCSHSCAKKGTDRGSYKHHGDGAKRPHSSGYNQIKIDGVWLMEHRHVMSLTLGRPLEAHERVHHRNGNRADNRPENLELWKVTKKDPAGVRAADYHCAGCQCFVAQSLRTSIYTPYLGDMPGDNEIMSTSEVSTSAALQANSCEHLGQRISHVYHVECFGPDGQLKWEDTYHNLVTTAGLNKYLDATLKTGLAAPLWYVGLITGPGAGNTYVLVDTMASHAGWAEDVTYSNATRPQWTPGVVAAGSVDNSAAKAIFTVNGSANVAGCFMVDNSTKGGATGVLLGEGNFTGGDRLVQSGDTLNVTVTAVQS